ncbi:MAG: hypothetical protein MMC33_010078, partial [Icmadophila ericetorum]|nr:hypothetical protein [Icmadophila ericetorum]
MEGLRSAATKARELLEDAESQVRVHEERFWEIDREGEEQEEPKESLKPGVNALT